MVNVITLQDAINLATTKNGYCLSNSYVNSRTLMNWQCSVGHIWNATYSHIRQNWCNKCRYKIKEITIQKYKNYGLQYDFFFIEHTKRKIKWECINKHIIYTRNLRKPFCKDCSIKKLNEKCSKYALSKGGIFLEFKNSIPLYKCVKHNFCWTSKNAHLSGTWCRKCAGFSKKIEDMKQIAIEHNGICISTEYLKGNLKLTWKCSVGHLFDASPSAIKHSKTWCPFCAGSRNEMATRKILESLFNTTFKKIRPNWLKYINGNNLELDGYSDILNLAFEYNGMQHYKYIENFSHSSFEETKVKDLFKINKCNEENVKLLIIKDEKVNSLEILYEKIYNGLIKLGFNITKICPIISSDYYTNYKNIEQQNKIEQIIKNKYGVILDGNYFNNKTKYKIRCNLGHIFVDYYYNICRTNNSTWCNFCKNGKI